MATMAFRVEFTGETAALRGFLTALAHAAKLLVVRGIQVAPASGANSERAPGKASTGGAVARPTLSHFIVTVEAVRPTAAVAARAP
jgi:hypothetical protein